MVYVVNCRESEIDRMKSVASGEEEGKRRGLAWLRALPEMGCVTEAESAWYDALGLLPACPCVNPSLDELRQRARAEAEARISSGAASP